MEYLLPSNEDMKIKLLVNYGEEFLRLNNLKVGDIVELKFPYQSIHNGHRNSEVNRYTWKKKEKGILCLDDKGCLFAESLELMDFYRWEFGIRRDRSGSYILERKKSVIRIGIDSI